ncbi:hypothetical protein H920_13125 [Fukomys damarensis]|uniref:Uncharacterized protein n=1 Tax=Fukomys damarensis TaxID=885580 RepID=A0A091D4P6_FUKDA|nr:hypothetical protein H920_13125 [Fukomys damarensis]
MKNGGDQPASVGPLCSHICQEREQEPLRWSPALSAGPEDAQRVLFQSPNPERKPLATLLQLFPQDLGQVPEARTEVAPGFLPDSAAAAMQKGWTQPPSHEKHLPCKVQTPSSATLVNWVTPLTQVIRAAAAGACLMQETEAPWSQKHLDYQLSSPGTRQPGQPPSQPLHTQPRSRAGAPRPHSAPTDPSRAPSRKNPGPATYLKEPVAPPVKGGDDGGMDIAAVQALGREEKREFSWKEGSGGEGRWRNRKEQEGPGPLPADAGTETRVQGQFKKHHTGGDLQTGSCCPAHWGPEGTRESRTAKNQGVHHTQLVSKLAESLGVQEGLKLTEWRKHTKHTYPGLSWTGGPS